MWFLVFVVCFATNCEQEAFLKPFRTKAECQSSMAEKQRAIKKELLNIQSLSCVEVEFITD